MAETEQGGQIRESEMLQERDIEEGVNGYNRQSDSRTEGGTERRRGDGGDEARWEERKGGRERRTEGKYRNEVKYD